MSKDELKIIIQILPDYYLHLKKYPQSLIAKILGIFTIKFNILSQEFTIMIMENLSNIKDTCVK